MNDQTQPAPSLPNAYPATLVIFGITGDLAHRKLLPGLYHLARYELLPQDCHIVCVTRRPVTTKDLLKSIRVSIEKLGQKCEVSALKRLGAIMEIITMDLLALADYQKLRKRLDAIEDDAGICMHRLFYLAIPSQIFSPVVVNIGKSGLNHPCPHGTGESRLLIEKPFGYDLISAQELIEQIKQYFTESQVYRIDHYLAKETVQNILTFRFRNPLFRQVWNHQSIKAILITAAEAIDIEGRAAFYEQTGALRDFIQSHLIQLLALIAMDEPSELESESIHAQKLALLKAILPIAPNAVTHQTLRGQYIGYQEEVNNKRSNTETYAAIQLHIDNDKWQHVPMLLRTGKALNRQVAEIVIVFSDGSDKTIDNTLTIRIQPNEGIILKLLAKRPGFDNTLEPVHMEFCYKTAFTGTYHPDAYERVLADAFRGDKTLFATADEVLASWKVLEHVTTAWANDTAALYLYEKGSQGPSAAEAFARHAAGVQWPDDETQPFCVI